MDWKSNYFKDRNHQTISTTSSRCLQYENQTDEDGRNKVTKQTHCCVEVFLENKTNIFDYNIEQTVRFKTSMALNAACQLYIQNKIQDYIIKPYRNKTLMQAIY